MRNDRPEEKRRARRGLGARPADSGRSIPASPEGRNPRLRSAAPEDVELRGKPKGPRAEQAKRRTRRDNPEASS